VNKKKPSRPLGFLKSPLLSSRASYFAAKNTTGQTFLESNPKALARLVMLCTLWTIPMWEKNDEHEVQKNTNRPDILESNPKALARLVMLCTLWTIPMWEKK
jgi:hypothetical protein